MNDVVKGLQTALALIETNGWWDGQRRAAATRDASQNTMCVVTATYWTERADDGIADSGLDLQAPLWHALPLEARTANGRTKDLVDFNDSHNENDVKDLFARAIGAEIAKSCTT